jgi:hypothetical protein
VLSLQLLQRLPTAPATPAKLRDALAGPHPAGALQSVLTGGGGGAAGGDGDAPGPGGSGGGKGQQRPYRMLYQLQALCALLFPACEAPLPSPAGGAALPLAPGEEAMADADAPEPVPAAAPADAGSPAAGGGAGEAAPLTQRELQERFIACGCLEVALSAADAAQHSSQEHFQRELGHLLVMFLHNVLDATAGRHAAAAAASASASASGGADSATASAAGWAMPPGRAAGSVATSRASSPAAAPPPAAGDGDVDMAADEPPAPSQQQQQHAAAAAPAGFDARTLQLLLRHLLALALDAGCLWGLPNCKPESAGGCGAAARCAGGGRHVHGSSFPTPLPGPTSLALCPSA